MALTKVTGHVVKPDTNIQFHNTKSTGIVTFTHTSNATSSTTGALQVSGGVGIVKDLHVGGNITVGGTLTYDDVTNIDSLGIITARGGINVSGGNVTIANDLDVDGHTELDNVSIAGITTFNSGMFIPDNQVIHLGNVSGTGDLQIYHDTNHSYVKDVGTGDLVLQTQGGHVLIKYGTDTMAFFQPSNKAELYFANSPKLATTNTGITVTGQGVFSSAITASTYIQGTSSNGGLKFYSDSSASKGVVLNTDDHLVPSHDSNSDLGLNGTRWRNVYADTYYGDGSNLTGIAGDKIFEGNTEVETVDTGSDGHVKITTEGNERLRITKDGDFVINGASPNHDTSTGSIFFKAPSGNPNRGIKWSDTSDTHYVKLEPSVIDGLTINGYSGIALATGSRTNSTWAEKLRMDINGRLVMGHTSAISKFHGPYGTSNRNPKIQVNGTNISNASLSITSWDNNVVGYYGAGIFLARSGSSTIGTNSRVTNQNTILGSIIFSGDDGTDFVKGAMIQGAVDNAGGAQTGDNDMPGRLMFHTTADGAQEPTERVRISSDGTVSIGQVDGDSSSALHIRSVTSAETTLELSTKSTYSGSLPSAKISFTQQNGTEIARIKCDTNTGAANMADLVFWTNYGGLYERMRITKTGAVAISGNRNQVAPSAYNDLTGTNQAALIIGSSGITDAGIMLRTSTSGTGRIYFGDNSGSDDNRKQGQINYYNNGDYMQFATNGSERLRITSQGLLLGGSDDYANTTLGVNAGDSFTGPGNAKFNTLIGKDAGTAIDTGDYNTALGCFALDAVTSGQSNTAIGYAALTNCTGQNNVGLGDLAGQGLTNSTGVVAIGEQALNGASSSSYMVAIGYQALYTSGTVANSIAIGFRAAYNNTSGSTNQIIGRNAAKGTGAWTGDYNTIIGDEACVDCSGSFNNCMAIGRLALKKVQSSSTTMNSLIAIGNAALREHDGSGDHSTGGYTMAIGHSAAQNMRHIRHCTIVGSNAMFTWNPTTAQQSIHESGCTALGAQAMYNHTSGGSNIAIGRDCNRGPSNSSAGTGNSNISIGTRSAELMTSGAKNISIGDYAGFRIESGYGNIAIGWLANYAYDTTNSTTNGYENTLVGGYTRTIGYNTYKECILGYGTVGKGNRRFMVGCDSGVYHAGNVSSWTTTSDERIKKNIVDNVTGLDKIEKIKVKNFEYRTRDELTDFPENMKDSVVVNKEGTQLGVIAQEINEILPEVVSKNEDGNGAWSVNSDNITWYLVNAVKELSAEVKALKAQINS